MKFIKIYERTQRLTGDVQLNLVVDVQELSDEIYESIDEYIDEASLRQVNDSIYIEGVYTHAVTNEDEFLEDMPLPDGTIVGASEFKNGGQYIIVRGNVSDMDEVKVGLAV